MGRSAKEELILDEESQNVVEAELEEKLLDSIPKLPNQNRPTSMVMKKAHTVFPAHLIAEAISTLHNLDLRWSGPITPNEMQYVQQYIFPKYLEYCNDLVEDNGAPDMGLLAPDLVMYLNISPELLKEEATVVRDTSSLSSKIKFPTRTRFFAMPHRRYMMQVIWYPWISPRLHLKC